MSESSCTSGAVVCVQQRNSPIEIGASSNVNRGTLYTFVLLKLRNAKISQTLIRPAPVGRFSACFSPEQPQNQASPSRDSESVLAILQREKLHSCLLLLNVFAVLVLSLLFLGVRIQWISKTNYKWKPRSHVVPGPDRRTFHE